MNWHTVQTYADSDPLVHWQRCKDVGLDVPFDAFTQLFIDPPTEPSFVERIRAIDWLTVSWRELQLPGLALRQVYIDRSDEVAVDDARDEVRLYGVDDDREDVLRGWEEHGSWIAKPLFVNGQLFGNTCKYQLLVGRTRLGNVLGLLDRGDLSEISQHAVWYGTFSPDSPP